jgi:SAM-dependent methyltransferase
LTVPVARERRLLFGEVADTYDRFRPSYPDALVDDVLALAREAAGVAADDELEVLEVGPGTGKATLSFAARGVRVLGIEPSAEMAGLARENLAAYPGVRVIESDFERFSPDGARFPLLYSAQAWHWVSPEQRYSLARAVLIDGGVLATFWNRVDWDACELRAELDEAYRRTAPSRDGPMAPSQSLMPSLRGSWEREIEAANTFARPEVREYAWAQEYASEDYVALLSTHSDHMLLEPAQREALFDALRATIDRAGGTLRVPYVSRLCLAYAI